MPGPGETKSRETVRARPSGPAQETPPSMLDTKYPPSGIWNAPTGVCNSPSTATECLPAVSTARIWLVRRLAISSLPRLSKEIPAGVDKPRTNTSGLPPAAEILHTRSSLYEATKISPFAAMARPDGPLRPVASAVVLPSCVTRMTVPALQFATTSLPSESRPIPTGEDRPAVMMRSRRQSLAAAFADAPQASSGELAANAKILRRFMTEFLLEWR